jgi:transcriptional regulator with XRE-family HTH domain
MGRPAPASEPPVDEHRRRLATRLRQLRRERSLTTRELARRAGVSASLISLIETERSGASIQTLRRIAAVLDVPIVEFLLDEPSGPNASAPSSQVAVVVRRDERRRLELPRAKGRIELLSPDINRQIEFVWFEIGPGARLNEEPMAHEGEEQAVVLAGTMHLQIGDELFVLETGDSIVFDSSVPHLVMNPGPERLVQISAITPPRY